MGMLWLNVFGGLAIFIFGMKMMSDGLHRAAGEKMRAILRLFSSNRFIAILSGTAVTAVIQSSSASTVMVIGFVNAGLLNLIQAIGIIFGANIGTTVTAQLVAFEISWIIMPSIIVGLAMSFAPRPAVSGWGETIIGLGFLFLGMEYMSDQLRQLAELPWFMGAFRIFDCAPVNGVMPFGAVMGAIGIGLLATMIIQSSSACTGIVIALGASGLINLYTAVGLVLGSNIGTTVTAQLAAIPANRVAKQAALAHTLFNVIGVCVVTATFWIPWGSSGVPVFFHAVELLSGHGDLPRRIANAHTLFNVFTTLLLVGFIPGLARLCEKLIPVRAAKVKYQQLEPHLLDTPVIALTQTAAVLRKMLKKAWTMVDCALNIGDRDDETIRSIARKLEKREERIDALQREITDYLALLMQRTLTMEQAEQIPLLLHCTNDAERIGDHTAPILGLMLKLDKKNCHMSREAEKEFTALRELLACQADATIAVLEYQTPEDIQTTNHLRLELNRMLDQAESNHFQRLTRNECPAATGILYIELLEEIRKVSRHLANISERAVAFYVQTTRGETGL